MLVVAEFNRVRQAVDGASVSPDSRKVRCFSPGSEFQISYSYHPELEVDGLRDSSQPDLAKFPT